MNGRAPSFVGTNIHGIGFFDYVLWVKASLDQQHDEPLGLPPLQRTALWTPRHILNLWDSLFRGMPIGMFYLIKNAGERRTLYDEDGRGGTTTRDRKGGYDLLDGQQRSRAMMLALRPPKDEGRCLWIDLAATNKEDALVSIRLTTRSQPFGYDAQGGKLSITERREARKCFDGPIGSACEKRVATADGTSSRPAYDHELFDIEIEQSSRKRPPLPAKASAATVPLHELIAQWKEAGNDEQKFKGRVQDLVGPVLDITTNLKTLSAAFTHLDCAKIALMLVERPKSKNSTTDKDWLLRLYERIGAGGIPLTNAELLYSIYKFYEPFVHDTVAAIETDEAVGRVMPATDIAGTALRIATAQKTKDFSFGIPDVNTLAKNMAESESAFTVELHKLIPPAVYNATLESGLRDAFHVLFDILSYDKTSNLLGLPKVMLVGLPAELIQVMIYWVVLAKDSGIELSSPYCYTESVRGDMIRFALFWHLCSFNHEKGAGLSFRLLKKMPPSQIGSFPGRALYDTLTLEGRERSSLSLVPPDLIRMYGKHDETAQWRSWKARFERDDFKKPSEVGATTKDLYRTWWGSRGKMLLWLQRKHLTTEFSDYDPSSDRDDEKPYDLDHIQPQAEWGFHWGGLDERFDKNVDTNARECFRNGRDQLGNGIGNFRWIGSSENRKEGANDLVGKLKLKRFTEVDDPAEPDPWMISTFNTATDAINPWITAGRDDPSKGVWTLARMQAFQQAVEDRALWLFQQFWNDADFAAWFPGEDNAEPGSPSTNT